MSKVVWVNGTFDVLHIGHIKLLEYARSLGDKLVVGVDTDNRVMGAKGPNRPVNKLKDRIEFLKAIKYVDEVWAFGSDEQLEDSIKLTGAKILIVGHEYQNKRVIGAELVDEVVYFDMPRVTSSTQIIDTLTLTKNADENQQWAYM